MLANDPNDLLIKQVVSQYQRASDKEQSDALFREIVEKVNPVLNGVANNFRVFGSDHDDLYQIAVIGLFRSLPDYRPLENASFFTFTEHIARARVGELYKREKRRLVSLRKLGHAFVSIDGEIPPDEWTGLGYTDSPLLNIIIREETELRRQRQWLIRKWKMEKYKAKAHKVKRPKIPQPKESSKEDEFAKPIRSDSGLAFPSVYAAARELKRAKKHFLLSIRSGHKCAGSRWRWA